MFLSRGDRDLGVAFQTHPGRQAFLLSGSKEPRSALESRRVSLGAHWATNYSLEEITVLDGFDTENDSQTISGKTFTGHIGENNETYHIQYKNKNEVPETIDIPVEKVWLHDNGGAEGLRTSVEVELFTVEGETETTTGKKLTLSESNQWKGTFEKLVKYANGKEVTYTVKENTENSHYTTTVTGESRKESFRRSNCYNKCI